MRAGDLLLRALRDACSPPLRLLPPDVAGLLERLGAPPRLGAHLRIVHDVACQLADWADQRCPALDYDREVMLFGAATHDIGKIIHVAELSGPGSAHERVGCQLLLDAAVSPQRARFAATHASWSDPDTGLEDLMVSVADKGLEEQARARAGRPPDSPALPGQRPGGLGRVRCY